MDEILGLELRALRTEFPFVDALGQAIEVARCDASGLKVRAPAVDHCHHLKHLIGWQESLAQLATLVEPDIPG